MTSVHDARYAKHQHYRFHISPSSSGTVTPLSSPRISPTVDQVPQIVDNLFSFHHSHSLSSVRSGKQRELSNITDSDGYNTEKYSSRKRPRNIMKQTLSHTPGTDPIPNHGRPSTTATKSLSRVSRSSSSSSSSSPSSSSYFSTPTDREETAIHYPNVGMGRKVAATLQLFKETSGPSEDLSSGEPSEVTLGNRRVEPFQEVEDVAEAFEFVKRSEWPARETAATRRERSMTLLERNKTRDSSINDQVELERTLSLREIPPFDVAQWRRDHPAMSRGRRRERAFDELPDDKDLRPENPQQTIHPFPHESSPIFIRPRSRAYHPSPSPPSSKTKVLYHHVQETSPLPSVPAYPVTKHPHLLPIRTTSYSRSPTPVRTDVSNPISPLESLSSWSTDDESLWETASTASTVASNTSACYPSSAGYSPPSTILQKLPETLQVSDASERFSHQENLLKIARFGSIDDETLAVNVNRPEERLPHIPLRPFRNQVGGHSVIYKFTKQAVCKVRLIYHFFKIGFLNIVFSH
jgi:inositol-hexakisphosphate 5-kinase